MLKSAAGIDIRHVPYRGSVPAMLDVIAGNIPFMVVDLQAALQQIRDGKLMVLGVTTPKRVAAAPDIPTLAESGLAGYELVAWQGGRVGRDAALDRGSSRLRDRQARCRSRNA
jgi:tripartite-type tricarboxylate transporter receptor subunit TctC